MRCERRTTRESDGIAFGPVVDLSDVMFRMLEPSEVAAAMDFPSTYHWIGTRRIRYGWQATRSPRQLPATSSASSSRHSPANQPD